MIAYNPKRWWWVFCSWRGTVLPDVWRRVVILTVVSIALVAWDRYSGLPALDTVGHTILGVVLGLAIVFRTNSSYERFWEGRKLWGSMVNASRNLARGGTVYAGPADDLAKLVGAYVRAVRDNLRGRRDTAVLKGLLSPEEFARVEAAANPPAILASALSAWVRRRAAEGRLDPIMTAALEAHVSHLIDCQGACERILRTPIPFIYAAHIKHLLVLYLVTLPIVLVAKMGWATPVAVAVIAFGVFGIEDAGVEVEDPFGEDLNDLPLDDICDVIARDAAALAEWPPPTASKPQP